MASVYVVRIIAGDIGWIARAKTIGTKLQIMPCRSA